LDSTTLFGGLKPPFQGFYGQKMAFWAWSFFAFLGPKTVFFGALFIEMPQFLLNLTST
jgi:hypothetical protein